MSVDHLAPAHAEPSAAESADAPTPDTGYGSEDERRRALDALTALYADPAPALPVVPSEPTAPPAAVHPHDLDALRREVYAETGPDPDGLPDGAVWVPLRDARVAVLNPLDWPASATDDVRAGWFTSWAMKALARDVDKDTWARIDPTNRECDRFLNVDWPAASGVTLGNSPLQARSVLTAGT